MDIITENSKDNKPIIKIKTPQREIYLSSRYHPLQEAEKISNNISIKTPYFLIIGLGNPYLIFSISKKNTEKEIIVIEPSEEIFNTILSNNYLSKMVSSHNIKLKIIKTEEELKNLLSSISYFEYYINPQYKTIFTFISTWEEIIKKTIQNLEINRNTLKRFGNVWAKNLILSLNYITLTKGIKEFYDVFKNINAIVIGAGPSLDNNLEELRELYNSFLIISVDTSWGYLSSQGIKPDIVITVDPQLKNFIYNLTSKDYKTTLFVCDTLYPPLIYKHIPISNILNFDSPLKVWQTIKEIYNLEKGTIEVGGSVVCSAIDLAYKLGANKVLLVGVDLGYPNQKIYSKNNYYELNNFVNSNIFLPYDPYNILSKYPIVEKISNNGSKILTDPRMITFKNWIENYITTTNISIINLSPNGLQINNTQHIPINALPKKNIRDEIEKIKSSIIEKTNPHTNINITKDIVETIKKVIDEYNKKGIFESTTIIENNILAKNLFEIALQDILLDDYNEDQFLKELSNRIRYFEKVLKYL